ncbi:hypothetical protein BT93_L1812 [Corymbia citriodora subsp. variegata]|uniref:Cytochrome P450 n=1 Tax=Corymbia citriodora subsp. variegata TaxID=360336 RepID=A0A8T0CQU1_CORYI|nr:hypothetical protein BT93_L1812 [Corymbia citriodora subsp. variegata]
MAFIFQSDDGFPYRWPTNDLVGPKSIISAPPREHASHYHRPPLLGCREDVTALDEVRQFSWFKRQTFDVVRMMDVQCRKKLVENFRAKLERRKRKQHKWCDLMDELMQIEDENGNKLSDDEVVDNIVSLIIGGFESISTACTWAFSYLALHSDVLRKLREERRALSKSKIGELITSEDVTKMKYMSKVVEETLRLANVSAFVFRSGDQDVEYQGWKVIAWLRYGSTDSRNFEDPLCFNLDRWNKPAKPGSFQDFGGGSRICAANMLARMQIALFLHHLCVGTENPDVKTTYLPNPKPADGLKIVLSRM